MASKGQRFKKYDIDFKLQVLKEYRTGASSGHLSRKYGVPIGTIKSWNEIDKKNGSLETAPRGRPIQKETDYKERYEILKKF